MKLYTEHFPEGIKILSENKADHHHRWIDYVEWSGKLVNNQEFVIKGSCDYQGWTYALFLDGERTPLLNPRSPYGKPTAMTA